MPLKTNQWRPLQATRYYTNDKYSSGNSISTNQILVVIIITVIIIIFSSGIVRNRVDSSHDYHS